MKLEKLLEQKPGSVIQLKDGTKLYIEENDLDYEFGRMCYGCKTHKRCYFFKDKINLKCPGQLGICTYSYTKLDDDQKRPDYYAASGAETITKERERQITEEGWSKEHDMNYSNGELLKAALCYINENLDAYVPYNGFKPKVPRDWPWDAKYWKPADMVKNLKRAGALIVAEIDRLNGINELLPDYTEDE